VLFNTAAFYIKELRFY